MTFLPVRPQLSARNATIAAFVALGACVGTWAGSLADVKATSGLDALRMAVVILIFRIAGIAATQVGGRLADRFGSRQMCRIGFLTMSGSWLVIAGTGLSAPSFWALLAVAALAGSGLALLDVSMNAHATAVDQRHPKPTLGLIHACFSLGAFCGSGFLLAAHSFWPDNALTARSAALTLAALFSLVLLPVFWSGRPVNDEEPEIVTRRKDVSHDDKDSSRNTPPAHRAFGHNGWVWIGLCAWAVGVAEGSAFDWCAVHVAETGALPQRQAAMALTAVTVAMMSARIASDRILLFISRPTMVRAAALIGVVGYVLAISSSSQVLVLLAWASVGFGAGSIAPQVFGAAGRTGSATVVGNVMGFAYVGFLSGPVIVGFLAQHFSITTGLVFPLAACGLLVIAATHLAPRASRSV